MTQSGPTLVVVDDSHHAGLLESVLGDSTGSQVVLSGDPLLVMRLRRDGHAARLVVDGLDTRLRLERDGIALDGVRAAFGQDDQDYSTFGTVRYGPLLGYTLVPPFIRAIRNLSALIDAIDVVGAVRLVVIGNGDLARAALVVADERALSVQRVGASFVSRISRTVRRLWSGRHTRWVNTDFRAFVLEPAYLAMLAFAGIVRRARGRPKLEAPNPRLTLLFTGDRFTYDLIAAQSAAKPTPPEPAMGPISRAERLAGSVEHDVDLVLAGATQPGRGLFRERRHVSLETFGKPLDALIALGRATVCAVRALRLLADRSHAKRFTYRNIKYWSLVRYQVALHLAIWPAQLAHVRTLVRRLARERRHARLFVSNHVTAYNRTLIASAREAEMASIGIQHGMLSESNGHSTADVDLMLVWGEASIEWYRQHGPQPGRFVVTGNPRFDALARRVNARPRRPRGSRPFTLVVCTGFVSEYSVAATEYENLLLLETAVSWARAHDHVRVVHKAHPGEEASYYQRACAELGWSDAFFSTVQHTPSLHDLLEEADVLLTGYSTTTLEAVALGTHVIVLDAIARMHAVPLDECADVTIADTVKMCHDQLESLAARADRCHTDVEARQRFLRRYLGELDEQAADRVQRQLHDSLEPAKAAALDIPPWLVGRC